MNASASVGVSTSVRYFQPLHFAPGRAGRPAPPQLHQPDPGGGGARKASILLLLAPETFTARELYHCQCVHHQGASAGCRPIGNALSGVNPVMDRTFENDEENQAGDLHGAGTAAISFAISVTTITNDLQFSSRATVLPDHFPVVQKGALCGKGYRQRH